VHEALGDPDIRNLVVRYVDKEALPTLRPIAGTDLRQYGRTVIEWFSNPSIQDVLTRICADISDRTPKFLLPVARGAPRRPSTHVRSCRRRLGQVRRGHR